MLHLMTEAANSVPVTILTGFLGSGKTTVLNHLLRQPSLADTVVIVNEFGAVGLDHLLIEQAIEDAVLLKNGCICCTVRGDVADTLDMLWQRREAGEIPPFRRIAIETTGLADPAPVAHALLAEPGARHACRLDGIVTTVDALHGPMQLQRQPEARRQVAMADRILVTKTDIADVSQIAATEAAIAALNDTAPLRHVLGGAADAADVFDLGPDNGRLEQWLRPLDADAHHSHRHLAFRHAEEIGSVVLRHDQPVDWPALKFWLESVLSLRGDAVLRLKGIVWLHGEQRPIVLQSVHHVVHPPARLDQDVQPAGATRLVLITRGLSSAGLRASFATALGNRYTASLTAIPGRLSSGTCVLGGR
ncbi:MAG TPA: GTP-binding protein [Acetobacteraceae bacterium]|nr:GTP-binding protein [Acetobacteraceae bacterium]